MLRDDYASELDYLYSHAGELARKYPEDAPLLGRDASPAVSRLLESAAFVFARLRQRLDDDLPEVIHPVIESVLPSLLRPLPCATILELRPAPNMAAPLVVPAGAPFASRPVDGVACLFRSTSSAEVRPWTLERVELQSERRELRLGLVLNKGAKLDGLAPDSALRLFFAGPTPMALDARSALLRGTREILATDGAGRTVSLLPGTLAAVGPALEEAEHAEVATLRQYFARPAFFAFVDVPHIDRAAALAAERGRLDVVLRLASPLARSIRLDLETVRLHCVPALNVQRLSDPLPLPVRGRRCPVVLPRPGAQVHTIGKVLIVGRDLKMRETVPFAAFTPPIVDPDGAPQTLHSIERRASVLGHDPVVSLTFEGPHAEGAESARVEVHVTDGVRPEKLGVGDVCVSTPGSPSLVSFANITPVFRALPACFERDRMWGWLQLLKTPLQELTAREPLAACLALANGPAWAAWPDSKPNADTFEPLAAVRLLQGAADPDAATSIAIDVRPEGFAGTGDMDLFGQVVLRLLASTLRPYESVRVQLCDDDRVPLFEYAPIAGTREGL
jgi:type VI secretion system protein ImpG